MQRTRIITTTSYVGNKDTPIPVVNIYKSNWNNIEERSKLYYPGQASLNRLCEVVNQAKNPVDASMYGWRIREDYEQASYVNYEAFEGQSCSRGG
jgi:hypothetical protein